MTSDTSLPILDRHRRSICRGCWERMHVPMFIGGPFSVPYRLFGIRRSKMNADMCTFCETQFKRLMKAQQIKVPLTILFADLRGYTTLSSLVPTEEITRLLGDFYETCSEIVWKQEGIVNKLIGDAVLAVFNFPLEREDHVARAVQAAIDIQRWCRKVRPVLITEGGEEIEAGIGIGIHTGETVIGEIGAYNPDFTVIGPVVNLTSRLQNAALPGEIVVTPPVYEAAREILEAADLQQYTLKGIAEPVDAYRLRIA